MHVVYQLKVEHRLEKTAEKDGFLMGVDNVVIFAQQQPYGVDDEKTIKKELEQRWAYLNVAKFRETGNPNNFRPWDGNVLALTIGQQIDVVAKLRCDKRPIIDTERCSSGGKEGLWGNNENLHPSVLLKNVQIAKLSNLERFRMVNQEIVDALEKIINQVETGN